MPSEAAQDTGQTPSLPITGRCYCGAVSLFSDTPPVLVTYCHCVDCRRWTGAPVGAFAAFETGALQMSPPLGQGTSHATGVERWVCSACGSPLAATFDYLPGQIYVPVGLLDNADAFPPTLHCHAASRLAWLDIRDDLPRANGTGRHTLKPAAEGN